MPDSIVTFKINKKFYALHNYTSTHADTDIYTLSPHVVPLNAHYETLVYVYRFVNLFSSMFGIAGVKFVSQTLSEANYFYFLFFCHIYSPFTKKRIALLYF